MPNGEDKERLIGMLKGYIYRHWIVNDKDVKKSYIGITGKKQPKNRWENEGQGYLREHNKNTKFARAIRKYGWDSFEHEIIEIVEAETEEELREKMCKLEKYYIEKYDSFYNGYNSTTGGESGYVTDEESRYRNSKAQKALYDNGYVNPMQGRNHTEETKNKYFYGEANAMYGKHHKEESKQKISKKVKNYWENVTDEQKKRMIHTTKIICLNTKQIFDSIKEACDWCGLKNGTGISQCCSHNGKYKSSGKHPITGEKLQWAYYEDYLDGKYELKSDQQLLQDMKDILKNKNRTKVICLETKEVFNSIKEAKKWCGKTSITVCCQNQNKTCGGYHWMYYDEYLKLQEQN